MGQFLQYTNSTSCCSLQQGGEHIHPPLHTASNTLTHTTSFLWGQTLNNTDSWDHSQRMWWEKGVGGGGLQGANGGMTEKWGGPAAACTVRSCEGVRRLRGEGRRKGEKRVRERQREFGWQPCSLFHTKSGARLSVKCLCVPKHHYCLLRQ